MLSPFEWWCRNFILPDICKPCLFVFLRNLFYLTYIEAKGEITYIGNTSRKMTFTAYKVITARPDVSASAADVLDEPVLVCRASGTCVVPKNCKRK